MIAREDHFRRLDTLDSRVQVHRFHCCKRHGCKYGDEYCSVDFFGIPQAHPCEVCADEIEQYWADAQFANELYDKAYERGYDAGCEIGLTEGRATGYDEGYDAGTSAAEYWYSQD